MDPPQRPRNAQQKISSAEWDSHFQTIRKLFLTDGYTLSDVRSIMERDYKFHATVAQYKKKTKAWKIEKNLPQRKIIPMIRKQDRRLAEGKPTTFFFQGQPVSSEKLERARKRFEKETAAELHPDSPIPATPSDVECYTPRSPASELDIGSPRPIHASVGLIPRTDIGEARSPTSSTSNGTVTPPLGGSPTALPVPATIVSPASSSSPNPPGVASHQGRTVSPTTSTILPAHWENSWPQWEHAETNREGWRTSQGTTSRSPSTTPNTSTHPPPDPRKPGGDCTETTTTTSLPPTPRAQIIPKPRWLQLRRGTQPRWWFSRIPQPLRDDTTPSTIATSNNKKDRRKDILEDLAHNETPTSLRLSDKDRKEILEDLASKLSEEVHNHPKDSVGALMKLVDLGNAVADLGRAKDAVEYYNQALEGFERIVGNDLHPIPDVLMNLATVYYEQREYENAVRHHRRSFTGYAKASDQETGHWRIIFQS